MKTPMRPLCCGACQWQPADKSIRRGAVRPPGWPRKRRRATKMIIFREMGWRRARQLRRGVCEQAGECARWPMVVNQLVGPLRLSRPLAWLPARPPAPSLQPPGPSAGRLQLGPLKMQCEFVRAMTHSVSITQWPRRNSRPNNAAARPFSRAASFPLSIKRRFLSSHSPPPPPWPAALPFSWEFDFSPFA